MDCSKGQSQLTKTVTISSTHNDILEVIEALSYILPEVCALKNCRLYKILILILNHKEEFVTMVESSL